jgi:hypothetical protein
VAAEQAYGSIQGRVSSRLLDSSALNGGSSGSGLGRRGARCFAAAAAAAAAWLGSGSGGKLSGGGSSTRSRYTRDRCCH